MSKEITPTHIIITAIADRVRNGIRFVKKIAQTFAFDRFSHEEILKFDNDHILIVKRFVDKEPELTPEQKKAAEQAELEKQAAIAATVVDRKTKQHDELKAILVNLPADLKNQDGSPSSTKITQELEFPVSADDVTNVLAEIATESENNSGNKND